MLDPFEKHFNLPVAFVKLHDGYGMNHQETPKLGPFKRFLGIVGIRHQREPGQWILLTRRFRLIILLLILGLVGGFGWFFSTIAMPRNSASPATS